MDWIWNGLQQEGIGLVQKNWIGFLDFTDLWSLNDRTILFLVILLDKTVSVDKTVFALGSSPIVDILKFIDVQRVLKQKDGHDISEADGAALRAPL